MHYRSQTFQLLLVLSLSVLGSCTKNNPTDAEKPPVVAKLPLLAPAGLRLLSLTPAAATLTWTDNSTNETAFIIEQSTDNVNFIQVATLAANVDTATVNGTFHTVNTYFFRVKAKNADTTTAASNVVSMSLLPPPSDVKLLSFAPTGASLQWTDNSTNESGFLIEQSVDAEAYALIDSVGANVTSRTIAGPFDSTRTYSFRVTARNGTDRSAPSTGIARTLGSWVFVVGGTYQMGSNELTRDERPAHSVTLSNYSIGKYEVTVEEYRRFTTAVNKPFPKEPASGWHDRNPIVNVSWNDAAAYCAWMDSTSLKGVRLPTEAEWEYAARGGANSRHFAYSGSNTVGDVAWYYLNSSNTTVQVGMKLPNELGIYDMSGNAFEWVYDWKGSYSYTPQTNPKGPVLADAYKVFRGGSWFNYGLAENDCRVEIRYFYSPDRFQDDGGFRIARSR